MASGRGNQTGGWPGKIVSPRKRQKEPEGGYKEFKIEELFESSNGDVDIQKCHLNGKGLPVVSAGERDNGIIGSTDIPAKDFSAGTITIDMFGNAYFQPRPYKMVTHARVFSLSPTETMKMNEKIGLFTIAHFRYFKQVFSYNNMCSWEKIRKLELELPITQKKQIDFNYIEKRMRELEEEPMRELEAYLHKTGFENCTLTDEEKETLAQNKEKKTKLFRIGELFDIATGRDIIINRTKKGNIPLISHQHDDNGISKRIAFLQDRRLFNHETTLPIADRGVFLATTQTEKFHIGTRVKALTFKNGKQTENIRLFFVAAINKLQILFTDYLTNATDNLPNLKISLPVTYDGSIDYTYMDLVITAIKKQCIAALKQEIERERNAYYGKVQAEQNENANTINIMAGEKYPEVEFEPLMAAESFERYKWEGFDQSIIDFFGSSQTILVGCYKGKKYHDWIHAHNLYNIRLGNTKGSMDSNHELFDRASLLVLYELGRPNKLNAYKITGHREMSKDELLQLDYPNRKPRKRYMAFGIEPLDKDLTFLVEHHLIERLIELNVNNAKGTPVFIEP